MNLSEGGNANPRVDGQLLEIGLDELAARLTRYDSSLLDRLASVSASDIPAIAYTSFDGDLLPQSELMKQLVLRHGLVPLNPESALGTYLVTNHYEGAKLPIILDCLSLVSICDEFWIMLSAAPSSLQEIMAGAPEGVLAELLFWTEKIEKRVRVAELSSGGMVQDFTYCPGIDRHLSPERRGGIERAIATPPESLHKPAFLATAERYAKYCDWMRQEAYLRARVPVCPHTLTNASTLTLAFGEDSYRKALARASFALRCDEVWLFSPFPNPELAVEKGDLALLSDIFVTLLIQPDKRIIHKCFGDVGVPKYLDRRKWTLTAYERAEAE